MYTTSEPTLSREPVRGRSLKSLLLQRVEALQGHCQASLRCASGEEKSKRCAGARLLLRVRFRLDEAGCASHVTRKLFLLRSPFTYSEQALGLKPEHLPCHPQRQVLRAGRGTE